MRQVRACRPFLLRVIEVARPRNVVALGVTAAKSLSNRGDLGSIASLRGRRLEIPGLAAEAVPAACWATYHPAAILHGNAHLAQYIVEDLGRSWAALEPPSSTVVPESPDLVALDTEFSSDGTLLTVGFANDDFALAFDVQDAPDGRAAAILEALCRPYPGSPATA